MSDRLTIPVPAGEEPLARIAAAAAGHVRSYVTALTELAAGLAFEAALPVLLVKVSEIALEGARLGALSDVVPSERFEPDPGPDIDVQPIREGLALLLEGIDEFAEIFDPLLPDQLVGARISDYLADVAADLLHGLRHYEQGRLDEALWWWQFSYLSNWGGHTASALRALLSVVSHQRVDADPDVVAAAEVDALFGDAPAGPRPVQDRPAAPGPIIRGLGSGGRCATPRRRRGPAGRP
ncbi:MAG: DUF5063 domain-containing protein [Actinomycetes bacterium]